MENEKIGNFEYDSVTFEEVLRILKQIPQIEICRVYKGLPSNGFHIPAYLTKNGSLRSVENCATIEDAVEFSDAYNTTLGNNIVIQRKKIPKRISLAKIIGLIKPEEVPQPYKKIGNLITFLKNSLNIRTNDFYMNVNDRNLTSQIVYFEKIGEISAQDKLSLYTKDYPEEVFERELRSKDSPKHIVLPIKLLAYN